MIQKSKKLSELLEIPANIKQQERTEYIKLIIY